MLLIIGAKLEYIITQLAKDVLHRAEAAQGTYVQVTDELFWFRRPHFVLYMIHFILFQNSFEIGFFIWIWVSSDQSHMCVFVICMVMNTDELYFPACIWLQILHHGPATIRYSKTCYRVLFVLIWKG